MTLSIPGETDQDRHIFCYGGVGAPCVTNLGEGFRLVEGTPAHPQHAYLRNAQGGATAPPFKVNADDLNEGITTATVSAQDALGAVHASNGPAQNLKVDREGPMIQLSGSLKQAENTTIDSGTYQLTTTASDGSTTSNATRRSGAEDIEVALGGENVSGEAADCSPDGCQLTDSWTLDAATLTPGEHLVQVTATDGAGNVSTSPLRFTKSPCCFEAARRWGSGLLHDRLLLGDVTGDGKADMVGRALVPGDEFDVSPSNGSQVGDQPVVTEWTGFGAQPSISQAQDVVLADLDRDGRSDLIGRNSSTGRVFWARSTGSMFEPEEDVGSWSQSNAMAFGDVNGDGYPDLIGRSSSGTLIAAYQRPGVDGSGNATVAFEAPVPWADYPVPAGEAFYRDVDGDERADFVVRSADSVLVGLSGGASTETETEPSDEPGDDISDEGGDDILLAPLETWATVAADADMVLADLDDSGADDLVIRDHAASGSAAVRWRPAILSAFDSPVQIGSFPSELDLRSADLDGEGHDDLIGIDPLTSEVSASRTRVMQEPLARQTIGRPIRT